MECGGKGTGSGSLSCGELTGSFYNPPGYSYAAALDGKRFLVLVPEHPDEPITQLEMISNWTAELRRRLPLGKSDGRKP